MAIGKIPDSFFNEWISPNTGAARSDVLVGPRSGVDAAIVEVAPERFLAIAEDPIFLVPGVTTEDFGWYTVHIGASDVAVTGVRPTHMTYSLLLPPDAKEQLIGEIVTSISDAARELGIAIVGGHTGYAPVVAAPLVGGITVFGTSDRYISPSGARVGDVLVMTKGAAIEATGILARQYRSELLERGVRQDLVERAARHIRSMSVVRDAEIAFAAGIVHAMHDATEGGVIRGICEMALSASLGVRVRRAEILVPEEVIAICSFVGIDPLHAISEGTLLAAVAPEWTERVLDALGRARIEARAIGTFVAAEEGIRFDDAQPLTPAAEDPFWQPFFAKLGGAR